MSKYVQQVNKCLLSLKKDKNSEQFDNLFDITAGHLLGVARLYLANDDLAEEAVSESYIKVLKYIQSFDDSQDGYNWLCKIVQNVALTFNLNEQKRVLAEQQFNKDLLVTDNTLDFSRLDFSSSIHGLDEIEKTILFRRFYLDEPIQSIAQSLNVSKAAISMRIKNICKKLQNNLKND